jgi:hypothetical protein
MGELLQSDVSLMRPTKYFCGDCTIGDALKLVPSIPDLTSIKN